MYSATYSPEDNKLRLYSTSRLDSETYARVKAAGFKWAPKQGLFVAPMWTPEREDLLIELAGEIGDEDTSLVDRAEERAARFEGYQERRAEDAHRAHEAVKAIADGIPLGQPILVGHHSERRARRDAKKIENGMRRAVKMWETSKYWEDRAAGAIAHAKYKERPDVRARRIKGIEADKRKQEKTRAQAEKWLKIWSSIGEADSVKRKDGQPTTMKERALYVSDYDHLYLTVNGERFATTLHGAIQRDQITPEEAQAKAIKTHERTIARCDRWIAHFNNRLTYERAMLAESGGLITDRVTLEVGGRVLVRGEWATIIRINKKDGKPVSVRTNDRFVPIRSIEEIKDYQAPEKETAEKVRAATKLLPLCNYRAPEGLNIPSRWHRDETEHVAQVDMTKAEYARIHKDFKGTRNLENHRVRIAIISGGKRVCVFLTDEKEKLPPKVATEKPKIPAPVPEITERRPRYEPPAPTVFDAMKDSLKGGGVQVVSAPQLFPTPPALADRMVDLARIQDGDSILEPSAGAGALLQAIARRHDVEALTIHGVEINQGLASRLQGIFPSAAVHCADFLACEPSALGNFDAILMNPPFENAQDIEHITHALEFLQPGGRLVAICANGPRQNAKLKPMIEEMGGEWEVLPAGTFKTSGTMVNAALITVSKD